MYHDKCGLRTEPLFSESLMLRIVILTVQPITVSVFRSQMFVPVVFPPGLDWAVSLVQMVSCDWGIPSTTDAQTVPWCPSGRRPCGYWSSTVSLVLENGQSLHYGQTCRRKNPAFTLEHTFPAVLSAALCYIANQWKKIDIKSCRSLQLVHMCNLSKAFVLNLKLYDDCMKRPIRGKKRRRQY